MNVDRMPVERSDREACVLCGSYDLAPEWTWVGYRVLEQRCQKGGTL